jgi:protein-S-isoprenylcysteine O-methyltransferase Ste14
MLLVMGSTPFGPRVWLAARSIAWALLLPGVVAGYVPWRFFGLRGVRLDLSGTSTAGLVIAAAGLAILVTTIWEFAHSGRGTLSPADPPRTLVVAGLYRYVRNPMYLGVTTLLLGEALLARSLGLVAYWAAWFAAVNAFVIGYEEPNLRARFGDAYERYTTRVGRWIPRRPAGGE